MKRDRQTRTLSVVDRRTFLKAGGAVGVVAAAGGVEGILLARRAPTWAQGTRLHLLQWVDFILEGDVELRRQLAEYTKQMKIEVTLGPSTRTTSSPASPRRFSPGPARTSS